METVGHVSHGGSKVRLLGLIERLEAVVARLEELEGPSNVTSEKEQAAIAEFIKRSLAARGIEPDYE